jgi:monoamine oxidase
VTAEPFRVIVIGAGAAGLACASRVSSANLDFAVLEAANRVGGRAHTDYQFAGGKALELGAQLVHGDRAVTHHWVGELGLHTEAVHRRGMSLSNSRRLATIPFGLLPFNRAFGTRAFLQAIRTFKSIGRFQGPDLSFGEFASRRGVSRPARGFLEMVFRHSSGADADTLGALGLAEEMRASDQPHLPNSRLIEGYTELMERRAAAMKDKIALGSRVTRITWSPGSVTVLFERGPVRSEVEFRGRCAVITVPLSILKERMITFEPPLPETKTRAIDRVSFGEAVLVYLRLQGPWPLRRKNDVGALWGNTSSLFVWRGPAWTGGDYTILSAFTTGREALRRAGLPDRDVVEDTMAELRSILPEGLNVADPGAFLIRRSPLDPFARGAYSFLGVGASLSDRSALAEPVARTLFFAGEATHDRGQAATVHGAIETGYRAAEQAIAACGMPGHQQGKSIG